jgi:PIN domain
MSTPPTKQATAASGIPSAAEQLSRQLASFAQQVEAFLEASTIQYRPEDPDSIVIQLWHDYRWGPLDNLGQQLQRRLLETWGPLMERIRLLLGGDPSATQQRLDDVNAFVTRWLDRPTGEFDFTIPKSIPEAKERFRAELAPCFELLDSLGQSAGATTVVPDTNVLIRSPDVAGYDRVLGVTAYTVVLIPPVLAELDALKVGRISPEVREKARKFSERIKEWRRRGELHRGVKVQGQVAVRTEGREPKVGASLSWLDPTVVDDRIIACVLEVQRRHPTDRVVLLTGDVNLLAKADMAGVPTADTPDPDSI